MEKKREIFKNVQVKLIDRPASVARIDISQAEIDELAQSISSQGLLQPVVINKVGTRYEVVAGDRRLMAVKKLSHTKIMARIVEMTKKEVALARATENLQRRNLTPVEEANEYRRMCTELKVSLEEIGEIIGKSPGVVKRRMDVLRMPQSFQDALHAKKIGLGVAEELWSCSDAAHREYLLEMAVEHGITTNIARTWVGDFNKAQRTRLGGGGEGRGLNSVMETEIIYRSCDLCRDPVDLSKVKELRMCQTCYDAIVKIIKEGGG